MRLIDADLLKKNCKCTGKFEDNFACVDLIELAKVIDAQPTVYNVETVVRLLEEQKELDIGSYNFYRNAKNEKMQSTYAGKVSAFKDAIDIVRNGGKV